MSKSRERERKRKKAQKARHRMGLYGPWSLQKQELLPSTREWFLYLSEERRANPGFRNIINERGELV